MNILLDTHIFLWFIIDDVRLPAAFAGALRDPANKVFVSVVALWEAILKHQIGKLPFPESPDILLPRLRVIHGFHDLPLDESSVKRLAFLPSIHRDPFDRMMICQALEHGMHFATVDDAIKRYPVQLLAE